MAKKIFPDPTFSVKFIYTYFKFCGIVLLLYTVSFCALVCLSGTDIHHLQPCYFIDDCRCGSQPEHKKGVAL